ncbi:MAG: hypothetical protein GYA14_15925 [Ignavibacteria bacterium]|nr:hypothetical protein [Ignavibacteria bacterium]
MKKQIKPVSQEYPELNTVAQFMADNVARDINNIVPHIKTKCPYPAQCTIELLIKRLEERV